MDLQYSHDDISDDEVFIGKFTLKEVKKRLCPESYRQTIGCESSNREQNTNTSFKIIETHSAPDILPKTNIDVLSLNTQQIAKSLSTPGLVPDVVSDWDIKADDSFLKIEKMVTDLFVSPKNNTTDDSFDSNELAVYESVSEKENHVEDECKTSPLIERSTKATIASQIIVEDSPNGQFKTPLKKLIPSNLHNTPREDKFVTPTNKSKSKMPIFKTPGNPVSHKKSCLTPSNKYQHVLSPVANYINKSPLVPLLKDVCPKKTFAGVSSIPMPVRSNLQPNINKGKIIQERPQLENVKLPSVAYKNAKETKVIDIPDAKKLPQNQWAKQVASSIPKAIVMKHNHREINSAKKVLKHRQEDSFADLSLQQADVSVCTQKSAFKPKKNVM